MSANPKQQWTPEQYRDFERASETRHEFIRGEIFDMSGGSPEHSLINGNTGDSLRRQLRGKNCRVYQSDVRLRVSAVGLYTYPDTFVICGELYYADKRRDTVTNPVLIVEVLSKSTENYDRGLKFKYYKTLETLHEYVLISQDAPAVERYTRQPNGDWLLSSVTGLGATVALSSVGCTLALADVYENVDFDGETE